VASDRATADEFGAAVSVDGDTAVIGAALDDDNGIIRSGSAYVFSLESDEPISVNIDIKPGNKRNVIHPRPKGGIWVAILSDINPESPFDPTPQVDIPTVQFGPDGAGVIRHKVKDVNKDGLGDLLLRFKIPKTGIACGDTEATLSGDTFAGGSFMGTDAIKTKGCKKYRRWRWRQQKW